MSVIRHLKKYNVRKILAHSIFTTVFILVSIFSPMSIEHPLEFVQGLLIATIALVAFCGVFIVQMKFVIKPEVLKKIPNVFYISSLLSDTLIIGFITIFLLLTYLIDENKHLLTFVSLFFAYQFGYFLSGAITVGLFRR